MVGVVLIVVGMVAFAYGGFFWTRQEKVIDAGPVQVTREKHEGVSLPPVLGAIAVVSGIALLAIPRRTRA
jgi:hypothetical protein